MSCNNAANRNLCLGIKRAEYLMKKRSGEMSTANFNAAMAALKGGKSRRNTRKNRKHGGANNNGPSIKYFEKLMANRAAARNAVNVRGNPVATRKNRKNSRKNSRKNRRNNF